MRLFVAVDPSASVRARLGGEITRLRPLAPRAKWVDPASLHVTLVFLGEIEEARVAAIGDAIGAVAARHAPIDLSFGGGGCFGKGRRARSLWAGIGGAIGALAEVHRDLSDTLEPLGYSAEDRAFAAHLTLARARDPGGDPDLPACAEALSGVSFGDTRAGEIVLYHSEFGAVKGPPTYTSVASKALTSVNRAPG